MQYLFYKNLSLLFLYASAMHVYGTTSYQMPSLYLPERDNKRFGCVLTPKEMDDNTCFKCIVIASNGNNYGSVKGWLNEQNNPINEYGHWYRVKHTVLPKTYNCEKEHDQKLVDSFGKTSLTFFEWLCVNDYLESAKYVLSNGYDTYNIQHLKTALIFAGKDKAFVNKYVSLVKKYKT